MKGSILRLDGTTLTVLTFDRPRLVLMVTEHGEETSHSLDGIRHEEESC